MRVALPFLAVIAGLSFAAACTGGGGGADDDDDDDVATSSTATPTPTPVTADVLARISCTAATCGTGTLRTVVYDCGTSENVVIASSGIVTLVESTAFGVLLAGLPAPATDCLHAILDSGGRTSVSGTDPSLVLVPGGTYETSLLLDVTAL